MNDELKIEHPDTHSLILRKARASGLRNLIGTIMFFALWYGCMFAELWQELWRKGLLLDFIFSIEAWGTLLQTVAHENPVGLLFILVPLLGLPELFKSIKTALLGEVFLFDGSAKAISMDTKQRASFADIRGVEIRDLSDEDSNSYRVSVLLNDGSSMQITESKDHEQMAVAASDIARVLNAEVVKA